MKKFIFSVCLATGLMAAGNQNFVSLSAGNAKFDGKVSGLGTSVNVNGDDTHYTLGLGHYYDDSGRVYAVFSYVNPSSYVDYADSLSVGYDFILPVVANTFSLYAGPVVGYTWYKESDSGISIDLSGFHYGAQAGAIVKVAKNIEVEAGYRYLIETGSDTVLGVDCDMDKVKMWYAGVNIRF